MNNNLYGNIWFILLAILIILVLILYFKFNTKSNNLNNLNNLNNTNNNMNNTNTSKKLNILHIGKTAGRAIKDSIKNEPNIKLARHQVMGNDLSHCECDIAAVIRDPKDRLLSGIYWFKQGGEKGEMVNHPCHKYVKNKTILETLQNPIEFQKKCLFKRNAAFIPTTLFIHNIEDRVIPICYNKFQEDYDSKIKPYKLNNVELKVRNKSSRPKLEELSIEEHEALDNFVNNIYKKDMEYYAKTCL